jgi:CRISPR/Cas system-associated exonuclease Cas4 (RecB family)
MNLIPLQRLIDSAHESKLTERRYHLGCSEVGDKCERRIWLKFRWAVKEEDYFKPRKKHKSWGQMLRLFRRGQNEESTIQADLESIGATVTDDQKRVVIDGHVTGSIDGIGVNVPGIEGKALLEDKTHSLKSFDDLEKHGVEKSKPQHYVQMQLYMGALGLTQALYYGVCKDDDRTHTELVEFDQEAFDRYSERGVRLSLTERMPAPLGDATWWECKMCSLHRFCHVERLSKEVNCRTCSHVTPLENGEWECGKWDIDKHQAGCKRHIFHPDLVPWRMEPMGDGENVTWVHEDGRAIINGPDGLSSKEILELWDIK